MNNNIIWNTVRLAMPCSIGDINDKKIDALVKVLNESNMPVNAKLRATDGSVVLIVAEGNNKCNVVILPNQIAYISTIENNEVDFNKLFSTSKLILDSLFVEEVLKCAINFEGNSQTIDSHDESLTLFSSKFTNLPTDVFGVGYRLLLKNNKFIGEYKIEPMIDNRDLYYYQLILNTINEKSLELTINDFKDEFENNYKNKTYLLEG